MRRYKANSPYRAALLMLLAVLFLTGCADKAPQVELDPMQSPAHHVLVGNQLLETGKLDQAREEFETALSRSDSYAPAYSGLSRVYTRSGETDAALQHARKATELAESEQERAEANKALLEALAEGPEEPDLDQVEAQFSKLQDLAPDDPESLLMMARAYERSERFDKAEEYYQKVSAQEGQASRDARLQWQRLQDRKRIGTELRSTSEIAELSEVSRAEVAATINEELHGSALQERLESRQDVSFKPPDEARDDNDKVEVPSDVRGHELQKDIQIILGVGLRGLQPDSNDEFRPDDPMLRSEMAMVLEELLSMARDDASISRLFIGSASPFSDVPTESYAFNAIMVCVTNNLMAVRQGDRFEPGEPLNGMEALRSITRLKDLVEPKLSD